MESLGYDVPDEETLKNNENNKKIIRKNELYKLVRDRKAVDYSKFDYNDICIIDELKDEGKVFTLCKTVFFTEKADIEDVVKMLNFDSYSTTGSNSVKITGNGKGLTVNYTFCFPEKIKNKQINLLKNGKIFVSNESILKTLNKTFKTDSYEINNLTQPWHFDQYVKAVYCVLKYEVGSDIKSALPFVERCSSDLMYGINNSIDYFVSKFKIREDLTYRSLKSKIVKTSIDYWIELFTPCTELCKLTGMRFRNVKTMIDALKAKYGVSDDRPTSRPRFR